MPKKTEDKKNRPKRKTAGAKKARPVCGLCGATKNLTRTECCGEWICDDEDKYVLFSYARNSCSRNHRRFTMCAHHFEEGHKGDWTTCPDCKSDFEHDLEMYVYYGTNEYNFKVLPDPPKYEPTKCAVCGKIIEKNMGGYSEGPDGAFCAACTTKKYGGM